MRFTVQFTGKSEGVPVSMTLAVDAADREKAWDAYKVKTGLRRWVGDTPPVITEVHDGADSGTSDAAENDAQ